MKYERMKRSSVRCNAVAPTGVDVEKILDTMKRARERVGIAAKNIKERFPSYMKQIRRLVSDPDKLRNISLLFSTFSSETDATIKLIDSAIRELNKGKLSTCAQYLKLAIMAIGKGRRAMIRVRDMPVTGDVINDVTFEAWRVSVGPQIWAEDQLEKVLREIGR